MSHVKTIWATPDIDKNIAFMARVSNPKGQDKQEFAGLLAYLMKHGHVSPFEMANVCLEINTTRDIGRQILRHRSFSMQEYSGRYADMQELGDMVDRECRLQDSKNRQNSLHHTDNELHALWGALEADVWKLAIDSYNTALEKGVAKEQARALLPEGLTPSRLYMNGNMRSWIFYLKQRLDISTQKEHRTIAMQCLEKLREVAPVTMSAFFPHDNTSEV